MDTKETRGKTRKLKEIGVSVIVFACVCAMQGNEGAIDQILCMTLYTQNLPCDTTRNVGQASPCDHKCQLTFYIRPPVRGKSVAVRRDLKLPAAF